MILIGPKLLDGPILEAAIMAGVYVSLLKSKLSDKERLFCMMAYTPKATMRAAIGAVPLSLGLACGQNCSGIINSNHSTVR